MAFKKYHVANTQSNLEGIDWLTSNVYAQLLNITYSFNTAHDNRSHIVSAVVGTPVALSSKTKTVVGVNTFLNCSQVQFPNSPSAKFIAFMVGDNSSVDLTDKILGVVDLNDGVAQEIIVNSGIGFNGGLFTLRAGA